MCVLAMAWRAHADWQLVVAANRDERHDRATAPLARWADGVTAGRDLVSGGTWLAVSPEWRFAAITNRTGLGVPNIDAPSRGTLVHDGARGVWPDLGGLAAFNPLNLVTVADGAAAVWVNRPEPSRRALVPGIHTLSNGAPEDRWPKTDRLGAAIAGWIGQGNGDTAPLFDALREEAPRGEPLVDYVRGSIFLCDPIYGTRSSTVVTVDAEGRGRIEERRFDAAAQPAGTAAFDFRWAAATG